MAVIETLKRLNLEPGTYTQLGCKTLNATSIANAKQHSAMKTKLHRRKLRGKGKKREDNDKAKEGETYGPGCF